MTEKNINSRIVHKHDTEENWLKAVNFYPKQGEIIIYDVDATHNYERMKIGDGTTVVSDLPFSGLYQSNWSQNDDSAPDYIQNRTHWEEKNYVEIVSGSVTLDGGTAILSEEAIKLITGKTYSVTVNGIEYNCVAIDGTASGGTADDFLLGNTSIVGVGTNTGEPFVVMFVHNMGVRMVVSDGSTTATISVVDKQSDIHKLDNKFLDLAWLPVTEKGTVCINEQRIIVGEIAAQVDWISEDVADRINNGEIQVGDIFVVSFDGVRYECPLAIENVYNQSRAVLGNLSLIDDSAENTGEPFVVWDVESPYVWTKTKVEHTIMVCYSGGNDEVYASKIPEGFLPYTVLNHYHENVAYKEDLNSKQDILYGEPGQIVGFDENGKAIAQSLDITLTQPNMPADAQSVGEAISQKSQVQIITWGADD